MTRLRAAWQGAVDRGLGRMAPWAGVAFLTSLVIVFVFPQQIGHLLVKLNMIAIGAWLGYWIDRTAFPLGRPHTLDGADYDASQIRRALIIGATVLAVALAV